MGLRCCLTNAHSPSHRYLFIQARMIIVLPELFPSTSVALEQSVDALKLTGAAFPVGIQFQSWCENPEVYEKLWEKSP